MKASKLRRVTSVALAAIAVVALIHFSAPTANADPAIVVKPDGKCIILGVDANGNLDAGLRVTTTDTMIVDNGNKVMLTCKATVANLSGRGQHFTGFICRFTIPSSGARVNTTDTSLTVSATGQATLKCTYKP